MTNLQMHGVNWPMRVFKGDHVVMYNVFNLLGIGWIEYEVQFFQKRNMMNIVLGLNH